MERLEQKKHSEINIDEVRELTMFNKLFAVDKERDITEIKELMKRKEDKDNILKPKYSNEQIEAGEWEENDFRLVAEKLRKEKIEDYFHNVADEYEQTREISNSIVRLDQEDEIADELRGGTSVLIRGNWRIGKTSMAVSLETHQFGTENSLLIDVRLVFDPKTNDIRWLNTSLKDFKKKFCIDQIAEFIAKKELSNKKSKNEYTIRNEYKIRDEIKGQIQKSKKLPFKFLNDYFSKKGEKFFLSFDEIIIFGRQPEKLEYIANLKNLSQVQVAMILHRYTLYEDSFKEIFSGYKTHFIRALTVEEVGILIREPLKNTAIIFTNDAIQKVFEFTGGRPMEVHNLCYQLMSPKSFCSEYKFTYRAKDIEKLAEGKLRAESGYPFEVAISNYKRIYEESMSDEERLIIKKLVQENEIPISEINANIIQPLINTTFVVKDDRKGVYRINGQLFKRVILDLLDTN